MKRKNLKALIIIIIKVLEISGVQNQTTRVYLILKIFLIQQIWKMKCDRETMIISINPELKLNL